MKKFKYIIDGKECTVEVESIVDSIAQIIVNGGDFNVKLEAELRPEKKLMLNRPIINEPEEESQSTTNVNTDHTIKAPLPGVITGILMHVGGEVKAGDTVVVLETMEMTNNIEAEKDGEVIAVCIK